MRDDDQPDREAARTRKDRAGGRQFGIACIVLGGVGVVAAVVMNAGLALSGGAGALVLLGVVAFRWPEAAARYFAGMSDKL